jgi:hypothetical protein
MSAHDDIPNIVTKKMLDNAEEEERRLLAAGRLEYNNDNGSVEDGDGGELQYRYGRVSLQTINEIDPASGGGRRMIARILGVQ